ncbi:SAM-dependent methyltransferase [Spinactinospora alkalitolerans]|uniref:SAM-dependent methyltransferase n=1 Tax=Spinactinospora alkalitolerans TaxID=687207 RepID=A0A852U4B9_9ACTN|nr:class I SAM-dependent methyltransferase [Spinactinospora alkalitolerans]NYE50355.1 SAM-dependent methyltransferase [Spinactinospora alkalitolerans]
MATSESDLPARVDALMNGAWLLAALAAAAGGRPLSEEHGALLGAAGYAERGPEGWRLPPAHRAVLADRADAFPAQIARILRDAADAAEGRGGGAAEAHDGEDDDAALVSAGRSSGEHMAGFLDLLAARAPGFGDLLRRDGLRFLDVGTGTGAIAATVVARVPGARAVGLDVQPRILRLAEERLADRGLLDRVELRLQDVADLAETGAYDLAWLPLSVIAPEAAVRALPRVRAALRPGGRLICATALRGGRPDGTGAVREAVIRWRAARRGITPWPPAELAERLTAAGYHGIREVETPPHGMAVVIAEAPR